MVKLQISYDFSSLESALEVARETASYADIIEIGTILLHAEGIAAIKAFKAAFPDKLIYVDAKLVDRVQESIKMFAQHGANIVSVLAGSANAVIQSATASARQHRIKIMLDLIDASSAGQSAMDASTLEVDMILFHKAHDAIGHVEMYDEWTTVRGNTDLPIFLGGRIDRATIKNFIKVRPQGIIVGSAITESASPAAEAAFFRSIIES